MLKRVGLAVGILGCVAVSPLLSAQETDENSAAQANNPLANMTAFNIHTYFIPEFTGVKQAGNQAFLLTLCLTRLVSKGAPLWH